LRATRFNTLTHSALSGRRPWVIAGVRIIWATQNEPETCCNAAMLCSENRQMSLAPFPLSSALFLSLSLSFCVFFACRR